MRTMLLAMALVAAPATAQEGETLVTGTVRLSVAAPKPKRETDLPGDPKCACLHDKPPVKEDLLADAEGGLKWAFVYVKKGLEGKTFPVPSQPVLLDQKGCIYHPRVFGIMVGQTLNVRNSDDMLHNVHGLPFKNREFNFAQVKDQVNPVKFTQPEDKVFIKCDIHNWMRAYAGVVDHPFHAVTDASGKFSIKGLPPGKYTLGIWQERCLAAEVEVEVKAGETKLPDVLLNPRKD